MLGASARRIRSLAVVDSLDGTQTDQAPSVDAVKDALANKANDGHNHDADYDAIGAADAAVSALGLGTAATRDVPASGNAASGQIVLGSDTRLSGLAQFPLAGTGSVYASIAGSGVNNFTLSRTVEYATGIYIASDLSVATMRMVLQVSSSGMVARLAIKPINPSGKPGIPAWASGERDFGTTGERDTVVGVTLAPGWYALCCAFFNGSVNPQFMAGNVSGSYPVWGRTLGVAGGQPINMIYRSSATNAALPDTSASTWVNNPGANVHIIGLIPS
jgi:hypothetical protein